MLDAKQATMIFLRLEWKICSMWRRTMHFRRREAGPLAVGAVAEQRQYALLSQSREPGVIRQIAIEGRLVQLEIAGVNDRSHRRRDRQPDAVGDAVRHAQDFHLDLPEIQRLPGFDGMQLRLVQHSVFGEPPAGKSESQAGAVDRNREFSQQVGEGADVVFMAVRHDDARAPCPCVPAGRRNRGSRDRRPGDRPAGNINPASMTRISSR